MRHLSDLEWRNASAKSLLRPEPSVLSDVQYISSGTVDRLGNVQAPVDVYYGRREEILRRRKEQEQVTLESRFHFNLGLEPNQTPGELRAER